MGSITEMKMPSSDAAVVAFVKEAARASRRVTSICSGAFVLAEAGLLDGRHATLHWAHASEFRARFPNVITGDMEASRGFFTVYRKNERYFFEIPRSLYGRDILFVNRVAKASADMRNGAAGYAGDVISDVLQPRHARRRDGVMRRKRLINPVHCRLTLSDRRFFSPLFDGPDAIA